ncbi:MAG: hypothetical protein KBD76_08570 [Bacteriovorax sp.]|nr:hypothetical protein [Bacteriovorax sp.]
MTTKIKLKNQEILTATKLFLDNYLSQKNRGVEASFYLSFYLSEDNINVHMSRMLRFNRMLKEVELSLKSQLNPKVAENILGQLNKLNLTEVVKENKMSMAFFASEQFAGFVFVPFPVYENVVVARSLHLKSILPWVKGEDQFYLITLSSKQCRLLKGDSFSLTEVSSVALTEDETVKIKKHNDKTMKHKILSRAEESFYRILKDDKLPIILGGVEELHDIYLHLNRDPDLLKERIAGNLDKSSFEELHNECLLILNSIKAQNDRNLLLSYREMKPYGKVVDQLTEITIAAIQGRVRNLMIASDRFLWGHLDKTTGKVTNQINKNLAIPEDDILDDLAEIVIARGGHVTLFKYKEMPSDNEAIAFLS